MSLQRIFVLLFLTILLLKNSEASQPQLRRSIADQEDKAAVVKNHQAIALVQEKQRKVEYIIAELQSISREEKAAEDEAIERQNLAEKSRDEYEKLIAEAIVLHAKYVNLIRKAKSKALADTQAKVDTDKKVDEIEKKRTEAEKQLLEAEDELASAQMLFISRYKGNPLNLDDHLDVNGDMQLVRDKLERVLGKVMQKTNSQSSTQASSLNSETQTTSSKSETQPTSSQSDTQPTSTQSDTQDTSLQSETSYFDTTIPIIKDNPYLCNSNRYLPAYVRNELMNKNRTKEFSAASKVETEYQGLEPLDSADLFENMDNFYKPLKENVITSDAKPLHSVSSDESMKVKKIGNYNRRKGFVKKSDIKRTNVLSPEHLADLLEILDNSHKPLKQNGITSDAKPLHSVSSDESIKVKKVGNHNRRKGFVKKSDIKRTNVLSPEHSADIFKNLDNSHEPLKQNEITSDAKPLLSVSSDESMEVKKIGNHNRRKRFVKFI